MNLLVLGPQGSGKGTQAQRLSEALGVPRRDVEVLRGEAARHKELVVRGLSLADVRLRLVG